MERLEKLLDSWLAGETNSEQERELKDFFLNCNDIPEEWRQYKAIFCGFSAVAADGMEFKKYPAEHRMPAYKYKYVGFAAILLLVVCVYSFVKYYSTPYCYVNGVPIRNAKDAIQAAQPLAELNRFNENENTLELLKIMGDAAASFESESTEDDNKLN